MIAGKGTKKPPRLQITRRRYEIGMTQKELAKQAGIHQTQMNNIERGRAEPLLITSRKISQVLGESIEQLFPF